MSSRCWLRRQGIVTDDCDWPFDLAHLGFTERWLRTSPTGPQLSKGDANDARLLRPLCRKHHRQLDSATHPLSLTREQLPPSVLAFADDHNLTTRLERDYPQQEESDEE